MIFFLHTFTHNCQTSNISCNKSQNLTHWGRVMDICVSDLTSIGSDNGLSPGRRQAIIKTKCWNIVNKTLRNKLQWIFSRNSNIFVQENAFESVVCEKAAILSRPQWVKCLLSGLAVVFAHTIEAKCSVRNEDEHVSEWSTILLPPKVQPILEVWQYLKTSVSSKDISFLLLQIASRTASTCILIAEEYGTCTYWTF